MGLRGRSRAASSVAAAAAALAPAAAAQAPGPPVLLAAGDIASCVSGGDEATALILDANEGTVATLGDNAYPDGTPEQFASCYAPTWGRAKDRTKPATGNHEYRTSGAAGYFGYFGAAAGEPGKGWYSYDLGAWHIVVLNSTCWEVGGCHPGSPQEQWLKDDLAAHSTSCTLAYWHHPRFSSARSPQLDWLEVVWQRLYEQGADVVLSAHDHVYERFAPQTAAGDPNPAHGIRQFIVGTGGHSHHFFGSPYATSEAMNGDTFGVLKLTLHDGAYDWIFLPEAGRTFSDSGSDVCHDPPADQVAPSAAVTAPGSDAIIRGPAGLAADAADDVAIARVDFILDGDVIASDASAPFALTWQSGGYPDGKRLLQARAVDTAGNVSSSWGRYVVIDNLLPATTILSGPPAESRLRTPSFTFSSEPGATFECSLDRKPYEECGSSVRLAALGAGRHALSVRARDAAGRVDPSPAVWSWTVDLAAPVTSISYGEMDLGRQGTAAFWFGASERSSTFSCSLDDDAWTNCVAPVVYEVLGPGRHSFRVRAKDKAGNTDWTAASRSWRVSPRAGGVFITGGPGRDVITGTHGTDVLQGFGGNDVIRGRGGNDELDGGAGDDRLEGLAGADRIVGGPGRDTLYGGRGPDRLLSLDWARDVLKGGPGRDWARFDLFDRLVAVEFRF